MQIGHKKIAEYNFNILLGKKTGKNQENKLM